MNMPASVIFRIRRLCAETQAQDLIEYALMAGFVAAVAGALMPGVATNISVIFSKVGSVLSDAARKRGG